MPDSTIWTLVDRQRTVTASMLAALDDAQWSTPSLCSGWTVRDVAAHLTLQSMTPPRAFAMAARFPGTLNHTIATGSRHLAKRLTTAEIVARQRALVCVHRPNPFTTPADTLVDALVHSLDIAVPLDIDLPLPVDGCVLALDTIAGYRGTRKGSVFQENELNGRLVALDADWSWGTGDDIALPVRDLLLLLSGRRIPSRDVRP